MSLFRLGLTVLMVIAAFVLQVAVFGPFSVNGVVPNVVLLVAIAGAIARGPAFGAAIGFGGGLLLDLAPPADHAAGQWALALVLAAALAGRVRRDARGDRSVAPLVLIVMVAVCSFVAASTFAISGLLIGEYAVPAGQLLQVVLIGVLWDIVLAPFVVSPLVRFFDRGHDRNPGRAPEPAY